jgi:DNA transformation protein
MAEFADFVQDLLADLGEVSQGRFFGGISFKLFGTQFAMCMGGTLYFVVSDLTRPNYLAQNSEPFSYQTKKGRQLVRRYYQVPEDVLEDQETLLAWANEAVAVASATKQK